MNEHQIQRAAELDKAIKILEDAMRRERGTNQ